MERVSKLMVFLLILMVFGGEFSCIGIKQDVALEEATESYSVGESEEQVKVSNLATAANVIPLDSTVLVSGADNFKINDSIIYVLNNQKIYSFSLESGLLCNTFSKQGKSKSEYIKINDFDIDSVTGNLYVLCVPNKIIELSPELEISSVIETKSDYERLAVVNGDIYLYSYYEHKLDCIRNGETACLMELPETPAWVFGKTRVFHKTTDGLLFTPEPFASVFSIDKEKVSHIVHLSFPGEAEAMDRLSKSKLLEREVVSFPFPKIRHVVTMDSLLIMSYSFGINVRACIIDRTKHVVIKDGYLNALNPFPAISHGLSFFATDMISPDPDMNFLDTTEIDFTYNVYPAQENEQLAVFEYVYFGNKITTTDFK